MNTFWVKIAIFAVIVVGLVVLINVFSKLEPKPEPETFYDAVEKDRQRFLTEPKPADQQPFEERTEGRRQRAEDRGQKTEMPVKLYFAELSEIDTIEAERFLSIAVPGRSIGRLPMTGFKLMVDNCRRIILKWPDSWYAYRAKQMLADMPVRFRKRYNITEEELDLSRFAEPRPGTKLFVIEGSD